MPYSSGYKQKLKAGSKSDAKGLEKVIVTSALAVQSISLTVNTIFYGKNEFDAGGNTNKRLKNPLDLGVLPLLDILTSIDACELVAYALDKLRSVKVGGVTFNPNNKPTDTFGIIKWTFQKTAFDVQTQIDGFYNQVGDITSLNLTDGALLLNVVADIKNTFAVFTQAFSNEDNPNRLASTNPDIVTLLEAFPQLRNVGNYINDSLSFFDKFSDFRQLRNSDIQKAVDTINKIRQYCVLIQSLNNPVGAVVALAQSAITSELGRLLKDVDVQRLVPTLKSVNQSLKKVLSIMNSIKSIINLSRLLIRVFLNLIFAFKVIIRFFKTFPAPNQYTTMGITTTASDALNEIKTRGPGTFEVRLFQLSTLLSTVSLFLNTILPVINEVIQKINLLITSIQRCENSSSILPTEVLTEIADTAQNLANTVNDLQSFLDTTEQNNLTRSRTSQLGEFTINIVTEQVVEETFGLRRRYGVALNNQGIIQVQSQPTFASDDNVIINEVKLLLQQNRLVTVDNAEYSSSEINVINEASSYLANSNIDMQLDNVNPSTRALDDTSQISLEIKDFVNSSRRGRRLFNSSRRAVQTQRQSMNDRLNRNRSNRNL
jgi:hypothetical protein